jgi:hypothetical protein
MLLPDERLGTFLEQERPGEQQQSWQLVIATQSFLCTATCHRSFRRPGELCAPALT